MLGPRGDVQGGFTLVEVVVAILILATVMLGVTGLLYAGWQGTQRGGNSTVALNLAQQKLEEIKNDPGLAVPVTQEEEFPSVAGYTYKVSTVKKDRLVTVTVAVYYEVHGKEQQVALTTMVQEP